MAGLTKPKKQLIPNAQNADNANKLANKTLEDALSKAQKDSMKRWESDPMWATFSRNSVAVCMDGTEVSSGQPRFGRWVKKTDTVIMDFRSKTTGNLSVPHVAKWGSFTSAIPTVAELNSFTEFTNVYYEPISNTDGNIMTAQTTSTGNTRFVYFYFNVLQDLKNKGIVPQTWTVNDLRRNLSKLEFFWTGYGYGASEGVQTNGADLRRWRTDTLSWAKSSSNTTDTPSLISGLYLDKSAALCIADDGIAHFVVNAAYASDGTIASAVFTDNVSLDVVVHQWVKEEKGIFIEEGTTNLLSENQSSVETDTTGFVSYSQSLTRDTSIAWSGSASLKSITAGQAGAEGWATAKQSAGANTTYTFSVYVKGSGNVRLWLREFDTANSVIRYTEKLVTLTDTFTRYAVTATTASNATQIECLVITQSAQAITFWADGLQLEQKPYATTWILGGTTRQPETLTVPTAGLSPTEGCIRQWVYVDEMTKRQANKINRIFNILKASNSFTGITLGHMHTSAEWLVQITPDGGDSALMYVSDSFTPNGYHLFELRWTENLIALSIDGVERGSIENPPLPGAFLSAHIGYAGYNEDFYLNGIFGQTQLLNYSPTAEESLAAFQQGVNGLTWDEHTIALYDWNNRLNSGGLKAERIFGVAELDGVVLASPNGTKFRLTIDNTGAIISTPV